MKSTSGAGLNTTTGESSRQTSITAPLPRYKRAPELARPLLVTPRDLAILEDVWRFGLLTTGQVEVLRGADSQVALRFVSRLTLTRRLKLLFHHRYLRRLPRPLAQGSQEPVYVLDHAGARALSPLHGEVSARPPSRLPKAVALDHLLAVAQVRVALSAVPTASGVQLVEWLPGEKVRFRAPVEAPGERRQTVSLVPDAGIVVRVRTAPSGPWHRHTTFLEVDRGTEALRLLIAKCRAYAAYWASGGFAHDFGVPRGMGFWVLFVAPTSTRAGAILKAIRAVDGPRLLFRVALAQEMTPQRIGQAVWRGRGIGRFGAFLGGAALRQINAQKSLRRIGEKSTIARKERRLP